LHVRRRLSGLRLTACVLAVALQSGACSSDPLPSGTPAPPPVRPTLDPTYRPTGRGAAGDVFVHLFEWKWTDVARECEAVLGPNGFKALQVSPPQEHIVAAGFPWWQRYQAVSYSIERSRSGTRAQFVDMVQRCRTVGVDIYVDAVINHMTAGGGTGTNGTAYTKYEYPGLYALADFHSPCGVNDYQSAANVQDCELLGLADLRTDLTTVQQKIADYLIGLARLGVAGFRIDAAKHIQPVELNAILTRVNQTLTSESRPLPYYFGEVIDYGGEAVKARDYHGLGYSSGGAADITEFKFRGVGDKFLGTGGQRLAQLNPNGPPGSQFSALAWGLMPADKAVVFLENHDTQRDGGIGYRHGSVFRLANVWMLAQPYGYPSIMSSYAFAPGPGGRDIGPPSNAAGETNDVTCAARLEAAVIGEWVCEHRDPSIARMVAFRRAVAGTDITGWWDNGASAIAFSRGDKGFVAINHETSPGVALIPSGLPAGTYCDVLTGGRAGSGTACVGRSVVVGAGGVVQVTFDVNTAIAIHVGTRL
jgi:alpha-amylase